MSASVLSGEPVLPLVLRLCDAVQQTTIESGEELMALQCEGRLHRGGMCMANVERLGGHTGPCSFPGHVDHVETRMLVASHRGH